MKKILLPAFAVCSFINAQAQQSIGVLGGLSILSAKSEVASFSASDSYTGFNIAAFTEFELSEQFDIQPELTYTISGDVSIFGINGIAKYNILEEFNIQAGPQIGFVGGDYGDALDALDNATKLNFQMALGAGYKINEDLMVQARYGFQLNNHYTGGSDLSYKVSGFVASVGYTF